MDTMNKTPAVEEVLDTLGDFFIEKITSNASESDKNQDDVVQTESESEEDISDQFQSGSFDDVIVILNSDDEGPTQYGNQQKDTKTDIRSKKCSEKNAETKVVRKLKKLSSKGKPVKPVPKGSSSIFRCGTCRKRFSSKKKLQIHSKTHSSGGEKPYKCNYCSRVFRDNYKLKRHLLIHTGENPFLCYICQKGFNRRDRMQHHMMTHTGEKTFACDICDKGFARKDKLQRHILTHSDRLYTCDVCKKGFGSRYKLKEHVKKSHAESEEEEEEEEESSDEDIPLKQVVGKVHKLDGDEGTENLAAREVCLKTAVVKIERLNEVMVTPSKKSYKCKKCNKEFQSKDSLKLHVRAHKNKKESPHKCSKCKKGFPTKGSLKIHKLSHKGEKPHKCTVCERRFQAKDLLKAHMKTHRHRNEMLFKCETCQEDFQSTHKLEMLLFDYKSKAEVSLVKNHTHVIYMKGSSKPAKHASQAFAIKKRKSYLVIC